MRSPPRSLTSRLDTEPTDDEIPIVLSEFVRRWCAQNPERLERLHEVEALTRPYNEGDHARRIEADLDHAVDDFRSRLRRLRNESMLVIAWRALARTAELEETMTSLSELADACVQATLNHAEHELAANEDKPDDAPALIVIGMGKLGGGELNFSSDIDLIFSYRATELDIETTQVYVRRLAQKVVQILNEATEDGFVFRVDTRLRPFGDSGPLAANIDAMESYYQTHGREWERYAWIKARPIAGDLEGGRELLDRLRPFVYRRYLDYGALESIREMKTAIEREVKRREAEHNIKIGHGGIREIEFIAQVFQLIRGGHDSSLQDNRLRPVLETLATTSHLPQQVVTELLDAYRFLRDTENRLQMWADQQTHDLPEDAVQRAALAYGMGFESWEDFTKTLAEHRRKVYEHFRQVFAAPQIEDDSDTRTRELAAVWEGDVDRQRSEEILDRCGFNTPGQAIDALAQLRRGGLYQSLGERGRRRLAELVPMLLLAVAESDNPDAVLDRVLSVLDQIVGRTAYVALLVENPAVLSRLISLCGASPWITQQIQQQPILLDSLLDPRVLFSPPLRAELEDELAAGLAELPATDLERRMDLLRRFKHHHTLRVAAADISNAMPLMIVSDHLTELAEIVLQAAVDMAWQHMIARHGHPVSDDGEQTPFSVIGYGKLGGLELGYGSDLDLVFLHGGREDAHTDGKRQISHGAFFMRLAQRIIHLLSTQTGAGRAYEVDTRLRPSGRSGLMVTSLEAFERYQRDKAWNWEHQALVRARHVAGDPALGSAFTKVRAAILGQTRDPAELREQVSDMREKMRANLEQSKASRIDLKQAPGGLVDIEFLAQYFVLRYAGECEPLLDFTDTIRILETMESGRLLDYETTKLLTDSYRLYRRELHAAALQQESGLIASDRYQQQREQVASEWRRWLHCE